MFLRDNCPLINLVRLAFSILNSIENYKKQNAEVGILQEKGAFILEGV